LYNEYRIIKQSEGPKAEERMKSGKADPTQNYAEGSKGGEVREIAAQEIGKSHEYLRQIDYVYSRRERKEVKAIIEKLDKDEISVHQAFTEVKKIETPKAETEPKVWKCGVCLQEQDADVDPVSLTVCPDCAMDFQTWRADKEE